ncbi:MAG TPA: DmsC/YnfH family molybdoenzyme membrane anchor subunit [Methylomirabilota bacterium]|nr:DmsC/YnfH family molybdoenzyme membrane anchor subunit [Methylomirabilota bacterium]
MTTAAPVVLIPGRLQNLWRMPAVVNFAGGGLGAGLYVVAALASDFLPAPALTVASWLGPLLVLGGFAAVATEAGRPLRGARVLARVATSWMSREVWIGAAFAALAACEFVIPHSLARLLALAAAVALVVAQGFIVRRARGLAAWNVPLMPFTFLVSSLVSGAGGYLLVTLALGGPPGGRLLGATLAVLVLSALNWRAYLTWSADPAYVEATRPLREGATAREVVGIGHVAPFALVAAALVAPALAAPAAALAGALMIAVQVRAKAALILAAGQLRPITVAQLRLQRRPS